MSKLSTIEGDLMSGPKGGNVRPNIRGILRSACTDTARVCSKLGRQIAIDEIENELKKTRQQCREARQAAEKQNTPHRVVELLDRMDARREDLVLLLKEERRKLDQVQTTRLVLDQALKSASLAAGDVSASESQLRADLVSLDKARKNTVAASSAARPVVQLFERGLRELQLWRVEVERDLLPQPASETTAPEESPQAIQERLTREAELVALKEEVVGLEVEPDGGWNEVCRWLKSQAIVEKFQRMIGAARDNLQAGDFNAARSAIEQAESHRAAAITEAERNRQDSERTQQIADAIMQALCDRKYDAPKFGLLKEGDLLSGIQIRADVPNRDGRGNIRVDIHLDGRTEFEVENVVEGEERLCREVLGGLTAALAQDGLELEITDWGRAKEPQSSVGQDLKIPVRERESERERPR